MSRMHEQVKISNLTRTKSQRSVWCVRTRHHLMRHVSSFREKVLLHTRKEEIQFNGEADAPSMFCFNGKLPFICLLFGFFYLKNSPLPVQDWALSERYKSCRDVCLKCRVVLLSYRSSSPKKYCLTKWFPAFFPYLSLVLNKGRESEEVGVSKITQAARHVVI